MKIINNHLRNLITVSIFFFASLGFSLSSNAVEKKVMSFVTAAPLDSDLAKQTTMVLTEAFKRLGYGYTIKSCPQKRCINFMKSGTVDGDATRVYSFNKKNNHPYYVRVDESHARIYYSIFSTNPDIKINSWDDLKKGGYRVGYLSGVKYSEQNLIGLIGKKNLIPQPVSNLSGLLQLLYGRIDVYVYADGSRAKNDLANDRLKNSKITFSGNVDHIELYPYLHSKHEALAIELAKKIKEINAEGLFDVYQRRLFGK